MNWLSEQLLESYREHIEDKSYIEDIENRFTDEHKNKYHTLMAIFNADERIRKSLAKRLGVEYEDFKVFLQVLKKT
jgi:hypothetical protein